MVIAAFCVVVVGCKGGDEPPPPPGGDVKVVEISLSEDYAGIDLLDSVFNFAAGDKISGKGKVTVGAPTNAEFVFNDLPGGWGVPLYQLSNAPGKDWELAETALTAAMIANIAAATGGSPKGIRIAGNNCTANTFKFTIEELKIVRGTTVLLDLAPHLDTFNIGDSNMGLILPGAKLRLS